MDHLNQIINVLLDKGYSLNSAKYYGGKIFNEWYGAKKDYYSLEEKLWAYKRGFLAETVKVLGINENNYREYINNEDYYILDPIDPITKRLVDGKLTIHYSIGGAYPQYMPKYYAWINENGVVIHMDDNIKDRKLSIKSYLEVLLKKVSVCAIKPLAGAGGIGFLKLELRDTGYYANDELIKDLEEIVPLINNMYVVTEYIYQCNEFDEIWKDSAATLRVISANCNNSDDPFTFVSYVRFGTKISKGACNLTSGGVAAPFNWRDGKFYDHYYRYINFCENGEYKLEKHPDSGEEIKGKFVPRFEEVKSLVNELSSYLSVHKYFGFDIIIGKDSIKICEINSHPSLDYEQLMFGGIWARNDQISDFFKGLLEKKNKMGKIYDFSQGIL